MCSFFADVSVSLLSLVVTACGLALFGVSLFVSWKLCWIPWRERGLPSGNKDKQDSLNYTDTETNDHEYSEDYLGQPTSYPESSMKISHTSPDIPLDAQAGTKENCVHNVRMHRQITEPTSSARSVAQFSSNNKIFLSQFHPHPFLDSMQANNKCLFYLS